MEREHIHQVSPAASKQVPTRFLSFNKGFISIGWAQERDLIKPRTILRKILGVPTRQETIFRQIDRRGHGLEIGPSHNPFAPKSQGFDVKILDCLDREGLIRKYIEMGVDPGRIEEVDYVWTGGSYADLVGGESVFDWIISSHSLEHIPDMAGFILDCRRILKPGGTLALVLPDHRFMFDHLRETSSLASVVDAHLRKDSNPTPGTVAEFNLLFSQRRGQVQWGPWSVDRFRAAVRENPPSKAIEAMRRRLESSDYQDVHVWCFTPKSFGKLVEGLNELSILEGMGLIAPPRSRGPEFYAFLRRTD